MRLRTQSHIFTRTARGIFSIGHRRLEMYDRRVQRAMLRHRPVKTRTSTLRRRLKCVYSNNETADDHRPLPYQYRSEINTRRF